MPSDAHAGRDPHPGDAKFIAGDPLAFGHQSPSESAMLPTLPRRLVDRHQPAEDLQLADGRLLRSDPEARVGDEHVAPGILDTQEHLEAVRGIVLRAQQGERLEAAPGSPETHFAAPDPKAAEVPRIGGPPPPQPLGPPPPPPPKARPARPPPG